MDINELHEKVDEYLNRQSREWLINALHFYSDFPQWHHWADPHTPDNAHLGSERKNW